MPQTRPVDMTLLRSASCMQHTRRAARDLLTSGSALAAHVEKRGCEWRFDEYVSSAWEQEWHRSGWAREGSACRAMALPAAVALSEQWLKACGF